MPTLTSFRKSKKGQTWSFIVKLIIWLAILGILILIIVKGGKSISDIIQKIKDVLGIS